MRDGLVYTPTSRYSYFADLVAVELGNATRAQRFRLEQHGEQARVWQAKRESPIAAQLRRAGFVWEQRVEPSTTQGHGGYFSPPLWVDEYFATANRPGRTLSGLIAASFPLPAGVSSISLPAITTGTLVGANPPATVVTDQDVQDAARTSSVCVLAGDADTSLQLLEQSQPMAAVDWAFVMDLSEAYDYQVEQQCLYGSGANGNVLRLANASGTTTVTWTSASPTGALLWSQLGQLFAQIGDARLLRPECWFMRSARWGWLLASEDSTGLPFGILSPNYLGATDDTPDPAGGLYGIPVFTSDAIPPTCTFGSPTAFTGGTQDLVFALRPSDMIFWEGSPQVAVMREP
ncbi:MAG TPA: hypothetical protein VMD59_02070, partial [Acidimicrobiales bacterium]|nr:hypothetical protein [Acidimicrobiales bacterium]